jgi:hypothetical protein
MIRSRWGKVVSRILVNFCSRKNEESHQKEIGIMKNLICSKFFVFPMIVLLLTNGCTSVSTPASNATTPEANMPLPTDTAHTIAEVEQLAGFDIKEPAYLPSGVSFDYATYQKSPTPNVTLHFKIVHQTYGDMGAFFQIVQEPQTDAVPNPTSCTATENNCEMIQLGDAMVK